MNNLIELAARCEAAGGEQELELLDEAFRLCFPKPRRIWVTDNSGPWTDEYGAYHELSWRFHGMIEAGAFLDAAMQLVPKGWTAWELRSALYHADWELRSRRALASYHAEISRLDEEIKAEEVVSANAATPALALCAASLRARAADTRTQPRGDSNHGR